MYPQPQGHPTLLRPSTSNSLPRPITKIPAPESGDHYQDQPHLSQSQLLSSTPSTRPEDKFYRRKRSNREIRETLARAETERDDRLQAEVKENPTVVTAPSLLYPFYLSAPVPAPEAVAGFSRWNDDLGPPSYASLPQLYQQQPQQRHTYIDDGPNGYDCDDEADSSPPLSRRTKKQRVGIARDLAMTNLDRVRFQRQDQVYYEMMWTRVVASDFYNGTHMVSSEDRTSRSTPSNSTTCTSATNKRGAHNQPFPLRVSLGTSERVPVPVRPLDPSLYFADSLFTTPDSGPSASGSPELPFVTPPVHKRSRVQQPPQRTSQLTTAIDATPPPPSPEQQINTMGNASVASVPASPRYHSGPYIRVQQQHQQQSQQTSTVNSQELINMNQPKRVHQSATRPPPMTPPGKTPTRSTTMSPSHLKLQAISGTHNKISPLATTPTATETTSNGTKQCEQEFIEVNEKIDRPIINFKNLPRHTDGASTKEAAKRLAAVKIDDALPTTRPNDHSRFRSSTTAATTRRKTLESELMPMSESDPEPEIESEPEPEIESNTELKIEPEVETELETEESGGQGGTYGRVAERWIVDAVVIPIPRLLRYYRRR